MYNHSPYSESCLLQTKLNSEHTYSVIILNDYINKYLTVFSALPYCPDSCMDLLRNLLTAN